MRSSFLPKSQPKFLKISALPSNKLPGQKSLKFWLAFWEKRWPHKIILNSVWPVVLMSEQIWDFFQNLVDFSDYLNFSCKIILKFMNKIFEPHQTTVLLRGMHWTQIAYPKIPGIRALTRYIVLVTYRSDSDRHLTYIRYIFCMIVSNINIQCAYIGRKVRSTVL